MQAGVEKILHRSWSGAGFLLFLAFVFACHAFPLTDTDIWWHLSSARWIWEHHQWPRRDPFCLSSLGQPWIDAQWGFQLLVYPLWKIGGDQALVFGKAGLATAFYGGLFGPGWKGKAAPILAAFGTYAAFHARYLTDLRPLWMTLLILVFQYRCLRRWMANGGWRPMALLILSQWTLAQMQGLFWLGPMQAGLLLAGERWNSHDGVAAKFPLRGAVQLWMGLVLVGLLNPYGWEGYAFPFRLLLRIMPFSTNVFSSEVAENIPFAKWWVENPMAAYPFLVITLVPVAVWFWSRSRSAKGEILLLGAYGILAWMAQRNLPMLVMAASLLLLRALETRAPDPKARLHAKGIPAVAVFCWALAGLNLVRFGGMLQSAREWEIPHSWETPLRFPIGTVAYLTSHDFHGALFNEMRYGGYLAWHLGARIHPFIDGRMVLHDADFMRGFLNVFERPGTFPGYQKRYGITMVSLPIGEDNRYFPLASYLVRNRILVPLYCDGAEVLLASEEAWKGVTVPEVWTRDLGDQEAKFRFGSNPKLFSQAKERIRDWDASISDP